MLDEPAISPPSLQPQDPGHLLPPGTTLLERLEADLNNDGEPELVLAFHGAGGPYKSDTAGISILVRDGDGYRKTWEAHPLSEGRVSDAMVRDVNVDRIPEILVFTTSEDEANHSLYILAWDGSTYSFLSPHGGPLADDTGFTSAYYAPEVRNVDSVPLDEIAVYEDKGSSERLRAIIYRWDGETYTYTDWITVLGPTRPSSQQKE